MTYLYMRHEQVEFEVKNMIPVVLAALSNEILIQKSNNIDIRSI